MVFENLLCKVAVQHLFRISQIFLIRITQEWNYIFESRRAVEEVTWAWGVALGNQWSQSQDESQGGEAVGGFRGVVPVERSTLLGTRSWSRAQAETPGETLPAGCPAQGLTQASYVAGSIWQCRLTCAQPFLLLVLLRETCTPKGWFENC